MAIRVQVTGTRRVPDPTGTGMGTIFHPRAGPVPDPNQGGYGRGYFAPPAGNPSGTRN
jgi:hypothetical protein